MEKKERRRSAVTPGQQTLRRPLRQAGFGLSLARGHDDAKRIAGTAGWLAGFSAIDRRTAERLLFPAPHCGREASSTAARHEVLHLPSSDVVFLDHSAEEGPPRGGGPPLPPSPSPVLELACASRRATVVEESTLRRRRRRGRRHATIVGYRDGSRARARARSRRRRRRSRRHAKNFPLVLTR